MLESEVESILVFIGTKLQKNPNYFGDKYPLEPLKQGLVPWDTIHDEIDLRCYEIANRIFETAGSKFKVIKGNHPNGIHMYQFYTSEIEDEKKLN